MRVALYPGTFDPITRGHEDLMRRAATVFDTLVVAVADNPVKKPLFELKERIQMAQLSLQDLSNVEVIGYSGLTIDLAKGLRCCAMIRGLRAVTDFEYEFQIASVNHHLAPEIETVFLPSKTEYTFISSSIIRELAKHKASVEGLVHPIVYQHLKEKLAL